MFFSVFRRTWPGAVAVAYAVVLVLATHVPRPERFLGGLDHADKLVHFIAYSLLAVFSAAAVRSLGRWSIRGVVGLALMLAAFAAVDEITQPLFARRAELLDWGADCAGIAVGILLVVTASSAWGRGSPKA